MSCHLTGYSFHSATSRRLGISLVFPGYPYETHQTSMLFFCYFLSIDPYYIYNFTLLAIMRQLYYYLSDIYFISSIRLTGLPGILASPYENFPGTSILEFPSGQKKGCATLPLEDETHPIHSPVSFLCPAYFLFFWHLLFFKPFADYLVRFHDNRKSRRVYLLHDTADGIHLFVIAGTHDYLFFDS